MSHFPAMLQLFAAGISVWFLAGCDSGMQQAPVNGTITYQNRPLSHGTIVFAPDGRRGGSGPLARAEIHPDGTYTLQTDTGPGAPVGWHRVTISAVEAQAPAPGARFAVPRSLIPDKYRDPELSGLHCEVKPAQDNRINFNLD